MQALRILSGVFALTPIHYFGRLDGGGRERRRNDPLQLLVHDQPNGFQTAFEFWELYMGDLMLTGNWYAYVSRAPDGSPVALTRLKPGSVKIVEYFDRASGMTVFFDATLPDATAGRFPGREILHVRGLSRDGVVGLNPMAYMRDAFGNAIATGQHAGKYFGDGAKPKVVLTTTQKVDPMTRQAIKADWKATHGGLDGDAVAVMDNDLKPTFLSHDNQESQFVETRQFEVGELARIWGVPPHLIFDLSRATFSNIEQQSLEFVMYHLGPHYARLAQTLTRVFAPDDAFFEHQTDALVKADLQTRTEAYSRQRQNGTVNANEVRAFDNLAPLDGDAGTEYWRPANMTLAGTPVANPAAPAAEKDIPQEGTP